jgi:hypothetical protein
MLRHHYYLLADISISEIIMAGSSLYAGITAVLSLVTH